ncbi:response regulator [Candidatus Riflebacteria bacterium]
MKRILIIEDAEETRETVRTILGFEGFEVIEAENGIVGIEKALKILPDLILCDVNMPGKNGFEVQLELQNKPETAIIPLIFLSVRASRESQRRGMDLGAADYLSKPFTTEQLLSAINMCFKKKEQAQKEGEQRLAELGGNIIYSLPHELLTPMTVIQGAVSMLLAPGKIKNEKRIRLAEKIGNASVRLKNQVKKFIQLAQLEILSNTPGIIETFARQKMTGIEKQVRTIAYAIAEKIGREGDLKINLLDAPIYFSEEDLEVVLNEVLENAFKFSPAATRITIENTLEEGNYALYITDKGRGMSPEQIKNIGAYMQFERKLYEQQGSGLGLVTVRCVMQMHAGSLEIESEPEKYTRITLKFRIP